MTDGYKIKRGLIRVNNPDSRGLPSEYQEVEYIETTGTQYITTSITPNTNTQVEVKIEVTTTAMDKTIFGTNRGSTYYHLTPYSNAWYYGLNGGESHAGTYSNVVGTQYEVVYNNSNSQLSINGTEVGSTSGTTSTNPLEIAKRASDNTKGVFKYFYFNVYNKSTSEYLLKLVPCYRKNDSVIGMYDLVNDVFYTNDGTGTFTKGNDVPDMVEKQIYPAEKKISCDFTQSDCGFTYYGSAGTVSYGRDSNGLYIYPNVAGYYAVSRSVPSNIYNQGTIKKVELVLYSPYASNGGGISVGVDTKVARTWINILETAHRGASSSIATTNPANTPYTLTIDLENAQMYCSTNANVLSLSSGEISGIQSDWTNGNVTICAMHGNTSYRGYAYIQKATFYL